VPTRHPKTIKVRFLRWIAIEVDIPNGHATDFRRDLVRKLDTDVCIIESYTEVQGYSRTRIRVMTGHVKAFKALVRTFAGQYGFPPPEYEE